MEELKTRATKAASRFLDRRGYAVLEADWESEAETGDIVAQDGDTLVFVKVHARTGATSGFPDEAHGKAERVERELLALAYLAEHDQVDMPIRFDDVSMVVVSPDRAMIRHNINSMAYDMAWEPEKDLAEVA